MTNYPSALSPTPALTDEATLETAIECLVEHLPVEMEGGYSAKDLFEILLRAASRNDSIERTAQRLKGAPSGNGIRYHLDKFEEMATVEQQLNRALQSRIPPKIRMVNLWVYLLWFFVSRTQRGGRVVYRELFCLKTMLEFLSQAVERHFPLTSAVYLPTRS